MNPKVEESMKISKWWLLILGQALRLAEALSAPSSAVANYQVLTIPTPQPGAPRQIVTVVDLMPLLRQALHASKLKHGAMHLVSLHTTTALTVNEWESRLARDLTEWLLRLAPPDDRSAIGTQNGGVRYQHNDMHLRPESDDERQRGLDRGGDVSAAEVLERWRAQEPINAHSHLASMLLGNSETVPVVDGRMALGQWQSVMLVDVDGPRERKVGVQCTGFS